MTTQLLTIGCLSYFQHSSLLAVHTSVSIAANTPYVHQLLFAALSQSCISTRRTTHCNTTLIPEKELLLPLAMNMCVQWAHVPSPSGPQGKDIYVGATRALTIISHSIAVDYSGGGSMSSTTLHSKQTDVHVHTHTCVCVEEVSPAAAVYIVYNIWIMCHCSRLRQR